MDTTPTEISPSPKGGLEKISFIVFLITIILAPLAFLPTSHALLDMSKTAVIVFGVLTSGILYFISAFKQKNLSIPKHPLVFVAGGIIASIIISTLLSTNISKSFFGQGFELGTGSLFLVLFLASLLTVYLTHKEKDRVLYIYGGIIVSFIILALFHAVRFLVGPEVLTFGLFQSTMSSLIGRWDDLALLAGIVGIVSYIGLQFITLNKFLKFLLIALLVVSGIFLFIVNSSVIWIAVALVAAGMVYYQYSLAPAHENGEKAGIIKRLPVLSLIILIIALACAWKGDTLARPVIEALKLEPSEVALPWQLTLDVASDTLKESPLFGAGPNRFASQYLKFKPAGINADNLWSVEFSNGSGVIMSSLATQGIVGFLLWCIFIIMLAFAGFSGLRKTNDNFSRFFVGSTFFTSIFLWIACFVSVPSHSIMLLTFVMTGLFISSLVAEGQVQLVGTGSSESSRFKKIIQIIIAAALVVCVVWAFAYLKKMVAIGYFQSGISALNLPQNQGIETAEKNFGKAISWDENDIYYQALSEVDILKITALSQQLQLQAQQGAKTPDSALIAQIGKLVEEAVGYTRSATAFDPTNYYNYVAEARISEVALSLKIENAYENTKTAYLNALKHNPYNPALYLNLARIEASQNKFAEAQQFVGAALQLKQNYIEAIFLLSQIQVSQGQIKEAITSVQVASQINPTNPLVFFQLGLLYYNDKAYQEAVNAFSKATELNNQYANAQYFLGLSYARLGKTADAISQFEILAQTNPDSEEVSLILSNLKAGKSPFADAQPPTDSKPEKRSSLPVKESPAKK
ncbi:MAG: tetratricopeptide repeat protein [Patescibacteria group bacterium]